MQTDNLHAKVQWFLIVLAWTGVAAVIGVLVGGFFGLLCGALLGIVRGDVGLVLVLTGRGALAGLGTGAMLGMAAKITAGEEEAVNPADGPDQPRRAGGSANGTPSSAGPSATKPRIKSG